MIAVYRAIGCLLLLLLLQGCEGLPINFSDDSYPKAWHEVKLTTSACPNLNGTYDNNGEGSISSGSNRTIAKLIFPKSKFPLEDIDRAEITGPENGIVKIRLFKTNGSELAEREWRENADYRCDKGWLIREQPGEFWPTPVFYISMREGLARTAEGQLVAEHTEKSGGLLIIIPGYSSTHYWNLFSLATK